MRFNSNLTAVSPPPIADVQGWVEGIEFSPERPLLDVAQAVPSYRPAPQMEALIADAAARPETSRYTAILGVPELRDAVATHFSEDYNAGIKPGEVGICAGCNQAFCIAISALAGPGDEVILPLPYYFNHRMWLDMQGIRAVFLPMPDEGPSPPDPDRLSALITSKTRAIVLVNPANPTGLEMGKADLEAVFELAASHDVALVLDETYKDFRTGDGSPHELFNDPRWRDTLIVLWSFSKSYSLTGYRVGAIVAGSRALAEIEKVMDCVAICASRIAQEAALFGLRELTVWRNAKTAMMAERREALREAFRNRNCAYELLSCGAFFAYLRHPFEGLTGSRVAKWLAREHAVLCVPGDMFGPGQEAYLRLAFANLDTGLVPRLVDRLIESQDAAPQELP